ncbi:hypothetical protein HMPREF2863_06580 [Micrococcus sp. HMSC067E09]|nr:hypothetical protein HMPREF2863_06580 [Micrococcus sp. HMSC067E09]
MGMPTSPIPVRWDGAVNAWHIRPGLFRMGRAEWLTDAGWAELAAEGVSAVVDLRMPQEVKRYEHDPAHAGVPAGVTWENHAIEDADDAGFRARFDPYPNHPAHYPDLLERYPDRIGAALARTLAAMEAGGAVLHCSAGRDRTGLLTALLLQLPELPGGPADRDEQHAVYTAGVRGINDYRRTAKVPHPHERWVPPEDWDAHLAERLAALDEVLDAWPADRVRALLPR